MLVKTALPTQKTICLETAALKPRAIAPIVCENDFRFGISGVCNTPLQIAWV
jgi:hypothetical protein